MAAATSNVGTFDVVNFFGGTTTGDSGVAYDRYAKLFGNPTNPNAPRQLGLHQTTDIQLPDLFAGRSNYLGHLTTGLTLSDPSWETQIALPFELTDEIHHEWTETHFGTDYATPVPHRGQARMLTHESRSFKVSSKRMGIAVACEHDALNEVAGKIFFFKQIVQMATAVQATANETVAYQLFSYSRANYSNEIGRGTQGVTLDMLHEYERTSFAAFQKDGILAHNLFATAIEAVKRNAGRRPDIAIIPFNSRKYLGRADMIRHTYMFSGPSTVPIQRETDEAFRVIDGLVTFEMRASNAYHDSVNLHDMSTRTKTIAEHYFMSNPYASQAHLGDHPYKSAVSTIEVYSYDKDRWVLLTLRDAISNSARFKASGEKSDNHAKVANILSGNDESGTEFQTYIAHAGNLGPHGLHDPAVYRADGRFAPITYFGDISHSQRGSWTHDDARYAASVLAKKLVGTGLKEAWEALPEGLTAYANITATANGTARAGASAEAGADASGAAKAFSAAWTSAANILGKIVPRSKYFTEKSKKPNYATELFAGVVKAEGGKRSLADSGIAKVASGKARDGAAALPASLNYKNRLAELENVDDIYVKLAGLVYLSAEYHAESLQALVSFDIPIPFSFLAVRPLITFQTASAIVMISGASGDTGKTYVGHENFQISHDANTKYVFGHLTYYSAPVIKNRRNIVRLEDILIRRYLRGGGSEPISKHADLARLDRSTLDEPRDEEDIGDVLYLLVGYNETENIASKIDLTGFDQAGHYAAEVNPNAKKALYYSSSAYYARTCGWAAAMKNNKAYREPGEVDAFYFNNAARVGTVSFTGYHRRYNQVTDSYTAVVRGLGHMGPYAGPGLKSACNGDGKFFPYDPEASDNIRSALSRGVYN